MAEQTDFKYTTNENRKIFVSNTYPVGLTILEALKRIEWDKYVFNGVTELAFVDPRRKYDDDDYDPDKQGKEEVIYEKVAVRAVYTADFYPYMVFGGACYEWLNYHNSERVLSEFMDPTGDVDISFTIPKITLVNHTDYEALHYFYTKEGEPNELLQHLLDWIATNLEVIFDNEEIHQHMGNLVVSEPDTSESTSGRAVKSLYGNKMWIVQSPQETMTKVQVSCQFRGMEKPDHILEFVHPSGTSINTDKKLNNKSASGRTSNQIVDGLRIQSFEELVAGNRSSLMARTLDSTRGFEHKYYNHVQRLKFLNMVCYQQFPIGLIPQFLFLILYLKGTNSWDSLIVTEKSTSEVQENLYGKLLNKLETYVRSIQGKVREEIALNQQIRSVLGRKDNLDAFVRASNIDTISDLIRRFDKPGEFTPTRIPRPTNSIRKCNGQECSVMGGRRRKTKRKKNKRRRTKSK